MAAEGIEAAHRPDSAPARELTAGRFSLLFEDGQILYVRHGGHEIIRRLYVGVRDAQWNTLPTRIFDLSIQENGLGFKISFLATNDKGPICFQWRGLVECSAAGGLSFSMAGQAESDFQSNRIGFCVLHPIDECRDKDCQVETVDGQSVAARFPTTIHPHLVFSNLRGLSYPAAPGIQATLRFDGDTFETEDQRQWGDASFKTYSRPLALPRPFEVVAGNQIEQRVTLQVTPSADAHLAGRLENVAPRGGTEVLVTLDSARKYALPALGLGLPSGAPAHNAQERARITALGLAHLRVDLVPMRATAALELQRADEEARALGLPLQIALLLSRAPQKDLARFVESLEAVKSRLVSVVMSPLLDEVPSPEVRRITRQIISHTLADVPVGTAVTPHFTELNRNREAIDKAKFICVPFSPQIHLSDQRTIVENLRAPEWMAETLRSFAPADLPFELGRVSLKGQPAQGGGAPPPVSLGELPAHIDVRQASLLLAGWTAALVGQMAQAGIRRATLFESAGWLGVMPSTGDPGLPGSEGMAVFPVFHALADIGEFHKAHVVHAECAQPLVLGVLALRAGRQMRVLASNFTATPRTLVLKAGPRHGSVRRLGPRQLHDATHDPERFREVPGESWDGGPIEIGPHELVRIDGAVRPTSAH